MGERSATRDHLTKVRAAIIYFGAIVVGIVLGAWWVLRGLFAPRWRPWCP